MAHECPDCMDTCYCGGDIDDMLMNDTPEEQRCTHFRECEGDDECEIDDEDER